MGFSVKGVLATVLETFKLAESERQAREVKREGRRQSNAVLERAREEELILKEQLKRRAAAARAAAGASNVAGSPALVITEVQELGQREIINQRQAALQIASSVRRGARKQARAIQIGSRLEFGANLFDIGDQEQRL